MDLSFQSLKIIFFLGRQVLKMVFDGPVQSSWDNVNWNTNKNRNWISLKTIYQSNL